MGDEPLRLNDAHRRALGIRLQEIYKRIELLRSLGVDLPLMDALQSGTIELAERTDALTLKSTQPDLAGMLIRVLIMLDELAPTRLSAYGELDQSAQDYLAPAVQRLYDIASELQKALQRSTGTLAESEIPDPFGS